MVERIDEMTAPPVVGQFYMVPTIEYPYCGRTDIWPTIGPKHTDKEIIGFAAPHYHVDIRFLTKRQFAFLERKFSPRAWGLSGQAGLQGAAMAVSGSPLSYRADGGGTVPHPPVIYRKKRCWRPSSYPRSLTTIYRSWPPALREAYADSAMVQTPRGPICPHKGAPLGSIPPDERGLIVCPLHGLCFDAKTGKAVEHPSQCPGAAGPQTNGGDDGR